MSQPSVRAEVAFLACRDFLFERYFARVQALQAEVDDGLVFDDFAEKVDFGVNPMNRDRYPILVLEQESVGIEPRRGRTGVSPGADLLLVTSGVDGAEVEARRLRRYADALINLIDEDPTFGGAAMLVELTALKIGFGREGGNDRGMIYAHMNFKN